MGSGGVWTLQRDLTASDGVGFDELRNSVSVSGNTAVMVAYGNNSSTGAAYIVQSGRVGAAAGGERFRCVGETLAGLCSAGWSSTDNAIFSAHRHLRVRCARVLRPFIDELQCVAGGVRAECRPGSADCPKSGTPTIRRVDGWN